MPENILEEREEWLSEFDRIESDVMTDDENMEYIKYAFNETSRIRNIYLPDHLQKYYEHQ